MIVYFGLPLLISLVVILWKIQPQYSLRTLLLVALIAALFAWGWGYVESVIEERREAKRAAERAAAEQATEAAFYAELDAALGALSSSMVEIKPEREIYYIEGVRYSPADGPLKNEDCYTGLSSRGESE